MKVVIFGLTVSSSWGNGHATLWRGLIRALGARGHEVVFFERDVPYYASHRDLAELAGGELVLYPEWAGALPLVERHLAEAEVAMVTSYCPDGVAAAERVLASRARVRVFYDMDTPITLERLASGEGVPYIGERGLGDFDLVLSFTGGAALHELQMRLGARRVVPLYGSVDPAVHRPVPPLTDYQADLSYLGTYSLDRQEALDELLLEPARRLPERRFIIGGSLYPADFAWHDNIHYKHHVPPPDHPAFYCSSPVTLNVTRRAMARMGFCPSGRLFEAAACAVPVVSDVWEGLERCFEPGREILIARDADDVIAVLELPRAELARIGRAARERALEEHSAERRALELERALDEALDGVLEARAPAADPALPPGGTETVEV